MTNEEIAIGITKHNEEIGSLKHRVSEIEQQTNTIQELVLSVKELAINMSNMIKEQEKASERIAALEEKPAKHWETIVTVVITAITSGFITYLITQILH